MRKAVNSTVLSDPSRSKDIRRKDIRRMIIYCGANSGVSSDNGVPHLSVLSNLVESMSMLIRSGFDVVLFLDPSVIFIQDTSTQDTPIHAQQILWQVLFQAMKIDCTATCH